MHACWNCCDDHRSVEDMLRVLEHRGVSGPDTSKCIKELHFRGRPSQASKLTRRASRINSRYYAVLFLQEAYQMLHMAAVIYELNISNVEGWSFEIRSSRFASYVARMAEAVSQSEVLSQTFCDSRLHRTLLALSLHGNISCLICQAHAMIPAG